MLHNALVSVSDGLLELDLRSPSIARSLARSLARSSLARSLDRSVARTLGRSIARSLGRSVARSLGRSFARSFGRSVARSLARNHSITHRSSLVPQSLIARSSSLVTCRRRSSLARSLSRSLTHHSSASVPSCSSTLQGAKVEPYREAGNKLQQDRLL